MAANDLEGNHLPKINSNMLHSPRSCIDIFQGRFADPIQQAWGLALTLLLGMAFGGPSIKTKFPKPGGARVGTQSL